MKKSSKEAKWSATTYQRHLSVGLFSTYETADGWKAIRVWHPLSGGECEVEPLGKYDSASLARAACDARIADLEACELALPSDPTVRTIYSCEQLEANRPFEDLR